MSNLDNLFKDFPSVSSKQWKQKIQLDLNGSDYNKTLLTHTLEGITIKPFYHPDSFKKIDTPKTSDKFQICQTLFINNEKTTNYLAKDAIKRGADCIQFIASKPFDFKTVLKNLNHVSIYFQFLFLDFNFFNELKQANKNQLMFFNVDLIGNLTKTGNWFYDNQKDYEILKSLLNQQTDHTHILGVDASQYQNAGANVVQQIAYALSHANEYLYFLQKNKIHSVKKINFNFSIGSNYFFEIAKFRAFRHLWDILLKKYDLDIEIHIFAAPTLRNKTLSDFYVNMLRTTTECMSGILGGVDVISNNAYDSIFRKKNEFGERIARNQLIILKEEGYLKSGNYTKGSYYIEELTYEIAEKALAIFKDIEKSGGFFEQLFKGTIQKKITENAQKEQDLFNTGELVLVGTNKMVNPDEVIKSKFEIYPFIKKKKHQTIIQPIISKRLSETIEINKLKNEM
ncbi:MAG: methylmalonyl-CoA mutase subunit beta [Flavobacteriaceae bacterium]|nr:methylmalonyl-CoA mutase subunit beta [Flavobacteriaceae bacterium]